MLNRAVGSVYAQTRCIDAIAVSLDTRKEGAWVNRDRALQMARTEWVAFLDDDDTWMTHHIEALLRTAEETGADYVFPQFQVVNDQGADFSENAPFPQFTRPWSNDQPHQTTITTLVRTELAQAIGFAPPSEGEEIDGNRYGEDFHFTLRCMEAGAKIVLHPEVTWHWYHHFRNTSGLPTNW